MNERRSCLLEWHPKLVDSEPNVSSEAYGRVLLNHKYETFDVEFFCYAGDEGIRWQFDRYEQAVAVGRVWSEQVTWVGYTTGDKDIMRKIVSSMYGIDIYA